MCILISWACTWSDCSVRGDLPIFPGDFIALCCHRYCHPPCEKVDLWTAGVGPRILSAISIEIKINIVCPNPKTAAPAYSGTFQQKE